MSTLPWITILIALPLLAAALLWFVPALHKVARAYGVIVAVLVLGVAVAAATQFDVSRAAEIQLSQTSSWIPQIGVSYAVGVNGLGLVMVLLATALVPIVIAADWNAVPDDGDDTDRRRATFVALVLVLTSLMVAVFAARDLFLFYVVFEVMLIPVYFLIGMFGGPNRRSAAVKFLLYSLAGGLIMLVGVVVTFLNGPRGEQGFLIDNLAGAITDPNLQRWLFVAFFVAFAVKAPMWPVHTWLPDATAQATPGTSTLLVGVLDKVGTFGMLALCLPLFPEAARWAAPVIIVLALVSLIYGALVAIGQADLMRFIAFTSVSHFGFIVLGIFIGSEVAMTGAMFYMLAHGLSIAGLFLLAGFLGERHTAQGGDLASARRISTYGGMQRITPVLAGLFLVAGLASVALPGLSGFIGEYLVLIGSFQSSIPAAVIATLGVVLAALYFLLVYQRVFTGQPSSELTEAKASGSLRDLSVRERAAMIPVVVAMLVLGFLPGPVLDLLTPISQVLAMEAPSEPFVAPTIDWAALSPLLVIVGAGIIGVLVAAFAPKAHRRSIEVFLVLAAPIVALALVVWRWSEVVGKGEATWWQANSQKTALPLAIQMIVLLIAIVGFAVMASKLSTGEEAFAPQGAAAPGSSYEEAARKAGLEQVEVFPLALFSLAGMLVFPMANDLLVLFVALEVLSLPLYVLTAMARRRRVLSQEAALKYFLLGAFSSALFLFGIALLYGFSGSLTYADLGQVATASIGMEGMAVVGFLLVLVGLLFKIGAVPFHAWVPDVYQGAPTPVTGFMAAATKTAAFGAILRLLYVAAPGFGWDLEPVLWGVAIASMLLGTVVAIVQTDVKRVLAYSSVAHAGFALVAIVTLSATGPSALMFYLLAYGLATVGAFAVVTLVRERDADGNVTGEATHLSQWAGLGKRHPVLASSMALFLLSFAGIPLTGGFVGKFVAFVAAADGGAWPLVLIAVLASAAAAFFYVRVIVLMFFTTPEESDRPGADAVAPGTLTAVALAICVAGTIFLGVWPTPVLDLLAQAAKFVV